MKSKDYKEVLVLMFKNKEDTVEDFENTLNYFKKLFIEEFADKVEDKLIENDYNEDFVEWINKFTKN